MIGRLQGARDLVRGWLNKAVESPASPAGSEDLYRQGALFEATAAAESRYRQEQTPKNERQLRRLRGLCRAVDPSWMPRIRGPKTPMHDVPGERIAHLFKVVYPFESTGGSIRNLNTIRSQAAAGLEPFVITPLNYPRAYGVTDYPLSQTIEGVDHFHFDFDAKSSPELVGFDRLLELDAMMTAAVIRSRGASLIHAASGFQGYELALKGLALAEHFELPLIYEVRSFHEHTWTPDPAVGESSPYTELRKQQENRCMQAADWVVTISETMREALIDRGVDSETITVIPNAIDPAKFSQPAGASVRERFASPEQTLVGYISNMSRREGHDVLLRALPLMREAGIDVACLLVGDGRERKNLEALAKELGIADRVHFTGSVDHAEINDYYRAIDLFVVPRRKDTAADLVTPLKPFEAMALEIPLVVSDRPALREIVGDDRGAVFRSEDHADLAARLVELARSRDQRDALVSAAREWVFAERTWTANAARYVELYARVRELHAAR